MKRMKEVTLSAGDSQAIVKFLAGDLSSRELGALLGCNHQSAINIVSSACREWYQSGKLILNTKGRKHPHKENE